MGVAQDRGEDVVLTHPVRAVRPLNFMAALNRILLKAAIILIAIVDFYLARSKCAHRLLE